MVDRDKEVRAAKAGGIEREHEESLYAHNLSSQGVDGLGLSSSKCR